VIGIAGSKGRWPIGPGGNPGACEDRCDPTFASSGLRRNPARPSQSGNLRRSRGERADVARL
jgi:hypothetical protein